MLNVLHITYTLEPAGAERIVFSLASKLNRNRYHPIVCALRRGGDFVEKLEKNNVRVYVLDKKKGIDFSVLKKLRKIITEEKIDIIHSHNFSANFWGRLSGIIGKVPVLIATEHSLTTNKNLFHRNVDYFMSMVTDCIIAVSEAVRHSHVENENISPNIIITIYNGIDINETNGVRSSAEVKIELKLSFYDQIVGIVGRLTDPKDHRNFLAAIQEIIKYVSNVKFLIVGDGDLREELIRIAYDKGLQNHVMFLGFRKDRLDIINVFDIAVLSSSREGLPMTLLEYMALGKPVVVTNVGGIPEVIQDGVNGFLVPPSNPAKLAEKIICLLRDRQLALGMGIRSKDMIKEKFTDDIMVKKMENIYEKLMSGKKT